MTVRRCRYCGTTDDYCRMMFRRRCPDCSNPDHAGQPAIDRS